MECIGPGPVLAGLLNPDPNPLEDPGIYFSGVGPDSEVDIKQA